MLVRVTNMIGVDLSRYRFDFDLTLAVLFLNAKGRVLGRFGGRDAGDASARVPIEALERAMERALEVHERERDLDPRPAVGERSTVMDGPAAEAFWSKRPGKRPECVHCHTVYEIERQPGRDAGTWDRREAFVYPLPENVGLSIDPADGARIEGVRPDSPASRAGLAPGDVLKSMGDQPILSQADVQWVLDRAVREDSIEVACDRAGELRTTRLEVSGDWKATDISWRGSMWAIRPNPGLHAVALPPGRRREIGIPDGRMAFEVRWVPEGPSRRAGIRNGDVLVAVGGDRTDRPWNRLHFEIRFQYRPGDEVPFTVVRDGREIETIVHLED